MHVQQEWHAVADNHYRTFKLHCHKRDPVEEMCYILCYRGREHLHALRHMRGLRQFPLSHHRHQGAVQHRSCVGATPAFKHRNHLQPRLCDISIEIEA